MTPTAVIIIPAYNVAAVLPRQLQALNDQTDLDFRVLVSDNRSTDDLRAVCAAWNPRFKRLDVVEAHGRQGVAHARNVAIRASDEELILICDGDDQVSPGWVAALKAALDTAEAATGPLRLVYPDAPDTTEVWNAAAAPVSMGFRPYMPGCNIAIRRRVLESVGLFDENLTLGQEDVDFGWRMTASGTVIAHAPEAVVDYFQRAGLSAYLRQQRRYGRALVHLYKKHCDDPAVPAPVRHRTSLRWFIEWIKQLPAATRERRLRPALGSAVFQLARLTEAARLGVNTPLG